MTTPKAADSKPTYLYRIYDTTGNLLYIGITLDLNTRMNQHRKHWKNGQWYKTAGPIKTELYQDRASAALAEHRAIVREQPAHNWCQEEQHKDAPLPDPAPIRTAEFHAGRWRI